MGKGKTKHVIDSLPSNESVNDIDVNNASSKLHRVTEKEKLNNKKRKTNQ